MSRVDDDSRDLAQLGYRQELHRSLGSFSSFAAGFSYISILTGMFQTSYVGFLFAGPAFIWAWPFVFAGQMMVALQFAELSAHYPIAGSVYQWAKKVSPRGLGLEQRLDLPLRAARDDPGRGRRLAGHPAADLGGLPDHQVLAGRLRHLPDGRELPDLPRPGVRAERPVARRDHDPADDDHQHRRRPHHGPDQQRRRGGRARRRRRPDHPLHHQHRARPVRVVRDQRHRRRARAGATWGRS